MTPAQAADLVEQFAHRYVEKWEAALKVGGASSDNIKAQGWAIMQAAAWLRQQRDTREGIAPVCQFCGNELREPGTSICPVKETHAQ